ncbi:hypothetical protein NSK_007118 [Nannochloropsis salina CCMP1776]|uniref:Uncharacterized protein n=1 Tax=Nannochloropsis salina CCMP1776 TaxID=1027361 RepID=A0A4D9CRJ8_9STRA|nr:hypothetical protein NSK_007118 [Nannochloropsis salina CCMP1776]|eukprot:TFJ81871.1 hypothetical protein NSK_007118 [Nannochloropsis salina CCMP1776]
MAATPAWLTKQKPIGLGGRGMVTRGADQAPDALRPSLHHFLHTPTRGPGGAKRGFLRPGANGRVSVDINQGGRRVGREWVRRRGRVEMRRLVDLEGGGQGLGLSEEGGEVGEVLGRVEAGELLVCGAGGVRIREEKRRGGEGGGREMGGGGRGGGRGDGGRGGWP